MDAVSLILAAVGAYLIIGIVFALGFVFAGVQKIDKSATGAPVIFRLMLLPAATALWPVLIGKWAARNRRVR